ncbi:MAG: glycosyltransferase [Candidatus Muiribacteriota bacterium]
MSTIIVTGGGTGGHTCAGLSFCEIIKERKPDTKLLYIGSSTGLEKELVKTLDYVEFEEIRTGKFRRSFSLKNVSDFFSFIGGIFDARALISEHNPSAVISTGGYVCLPVVVAAYLSGIPVVAHEQTTIPGLSNKIAFKIAENILLSYPDTKINKKNVKITGNPVRLELEKKYIDFKNQSKNVGKPVLFVTGGANGASILNSFVIENIDWLADNFIIYHQYGNHAENIEKYEEKLKNISRDNFFAQRFFSNEKLAEIYSNEPVLLGRAGAGTIADIINFRLVSVLIPLKNSAGGEQYSNANMLASEGAAFIVNEEENNFSAIKQAVLNAFVQSKKVKEKIGKYPVWNRELVTKILDLYL